VDLAVFLEHLLCTGERILGGGALLREGGARGELVLQRHLAFAGSLRERI
jgi:hypothetical protein